MTRARRSAAIAAAMGVIAFAPVVVADPAAACSCASVGGIATSLAAGATVGIVTRTDPGNGANRDDDLDATFTVHHALGGELPPQLTGAVGDGGSCTPYIAPGGVAAVGFARRDGDAGWQLSGCGTHDLGDALRHALGDPRPVAGGPAVAFAAGSFGGSRLAAVDAEGRPVAWDSGGGAGNTVAVCPDGRTVVVTSRSEAEDAPDTVQELTVHDARTLDRRRTVQLPLGGYGRIHALRCADPDGRRVEILAADTEDDHPGVGELLVVEDSAVRRIDLGTAVTQGAATADGFVAVTGKQPQALTRISPDGKASLLADLGDIGVGTAPLVVSPDGRTIAVFGEGRGDNPLRTFDTTTGERLGEWTTEQAYVTGLAWTASNRLLVRHESEYRQSPVPLRVFDRELRHEQQGPGVTGEWGGQLAAIGEAAVTTGGAPLTGTAADGSRLVASELRLAAATTIVPATEQAAFAIPEAPPVEPPTATVDEGRGLR